MFVNALLLFLVQPMFAKLLLPRFGGSPAVWTTCMLFFQSALLAGYAYSHSVVKLRKPTDATFNAIRAKLTPGALVELQLSVGFYVMTSKFLETFAIDMQPVSEVIA